LVTKMTDLCFHYTIRFALKLCFFGSLCIENYTKMRSE
jgi:hypothetical protein